MAKIKKAVVLAGGLGTRLRPYTLFVPKPMLPLGDKPMLEHLLEWLKRNEIDNVLICTSYLGRVIEEYFDDRSDLGIQVSFYRTPRVMGTAGQLKSAEKAIDSAFVCVYGDSVFNFRLKPLIEFHQKKRAKVTMVLMKYNTTLRYGFIDIDKGGRVRSWREKPQVSGLVNAGCYVMEKSFLKYIPKGTMFGMDQAFNMAKEDGAPVFGYQAKGEFIDIGDRQAYAAANNQYLGRLGKVL